MKIISRLFIGMMVTLNMVFAGLMLLATYSCYIPPKTFVLLSSFGLAFPIFLAVNVLFLIFWLIIQKYRISLACLVVFLICYPGINRYISINFNREEPPANSIKLLSYNVMAFNGGQKNSPILKYLKESKADIICLQEFIVQGSTTQLTHQTINNLLKDYPYRSIRKVGNADDGYSNLLACYSKFPIISAKNLESESSFNGAVTYQLSYQKDTLTLINCHLESNKLTGDDRKLYKEMIKAPEKEKAKSGARTLLKKLNEAALLRAPQGEKIAETVRKHAHHPVIVCGDFNDTSFSYTYHAASLGLKDCFIRSGNGLGISYNQNLFYFRIDHILTSPEIESYQCTVDRSIKESDHYPIWCYLSIP